MKQCPKCNKTYDDTWKICLYDQTVLKQGVIPQPIMTEIVKEMPKKSWKEHFKSPTGQFLVLIHFFFASWILLSEYNYAGHYSNGGWGIMILGVGDAIAAIPALIVTFILDLILGGSRMGASNVQLQVLAAVPGFLIFGSIQWYAIGYLVERFITYLGKKLARKSAHE